MTFIDYCDKRGLDMARHRFRSNDSIRIVTEFFLLICLLVSCGQGLPCIEWQKCLGGSGDDNAYDVQQTSDGGYIVAGRAASNNGDVRGNHGRADLWVVKLEASGNKVWQRCLGGGDDDGALSIQQAFDGGYVLAGGTKSNSNSGNVIGTHGGADAWVVKLDASGTLEWQKCLGGSSSDYAQSVQPTADGGYIVAGYTESDNGDVSGNRGGADFWIVKLDHDGTIMWQRCLGGSSDDVAQRIRQTSDGGYIAAGWSRSDDGDVSGNHGSMDCWIVKIDANGSPVWQRCLGGSGDDSAQSIQQTSDGWYILAGWTDSNDGDVRGNHGSADAWRSGLIHPAIWSGRDAWADGQAMMPRAYGRPQMAGTSSQDPLNSTTVMLAVTAAVMTAGL
jgi:hypothetical protein